MPGARLAIASAALLFAACGDEPTQDLGPRGPVHFSVRGRWQDLDRITYRVDTKDAPLPAEQFVAAIDRACARWTATGAVTFVAAAAGEDADVTLSFLRAPHVFSNDSTVAQAGPVGPDSYVHFDAARKWVEDSPHDKSGYSVYGTALHELGHVLGLGHSVADDAVMQTGVVRTMPMSESDICGLQSLYGGGVDRPGDLRIVDEAGKQLAVLRGVAMAGKSAFAVFDVNGDGNDDVVVWRTDREGHGQLMSYHFDDAAQLVGTTGPYFGMAAPGAANLVMKTEAAERLFVTVYNNGKRIARRFDQFGLLQPFSVDGLEGEIAAALARGNSLAGDIGGDGQSERLVPVAR